MFKISKINNKDLVYTNALNDNIYLGSVISTLRNKEPNNSWKFLNGQKLRISDYQAFYNEFNDLLPLDEVDNNYFHLPDFRECVLVGAGQNEKLKITTHDSYNVGEFKDDQLQDHAHNGSTLGGTDNTGCICCKNWNRRDATSEKGVNSADLKFPSRVGETTHGKQIGINYLIRVL